MRADQHLADRVSSIAEDLSTAVDALHGLFDLLNHLEEPPRDPIHRLVDGMGEKVGADLSQVAVDLQQLSEELQAPHRATWAKRAKVAAR